jgi:alpha-N-dichloroacetyl-p-aminophenylserinol N-oxygenase
MYTHLSTDNHACSSSCSSGASAQEMGAQVSEILAGSWANRVAARTSNLDLRSYYDETIPDFPLEQVPFRDDPRFLALGPESRRRLLAAAWISYNEKTIAVEKAVVAPACELLLTGAFPGMDTPAFKRTVCQTIVDEQFHVLMCVDACLVARELHDIPTLRIPKPLVTVYLEEFLASCACARDAELAQFAFATVAEVTINAYLNLLANDQSIQPLNRVTTALHRKDESSHSKLFKEFTKTIFARLDEEARAAYQRGLTSGLEAFAKLDVAAWREILDHLGVPEAADIIQQCLISGRSKRVVRDFSGFRSLLREIGLRESDVAFKFDPVGGAGGQAKIGE